MHGQYRRDDGTDEEKQQDPPWFDEQTAHRGQKSANRECRMAERLIIGRSDGRAGRWLAPVASNADRVKSLAYPGFTATTNCWNALDTASCPPT